MRVFLNPGHDPEYDSGAVNQGMGLRECDVARDVGAPPLPCNRGVYATF